MEYGVKFRVYPTPKQTETLEQIFDCRRLVWNYFRDRWQNEYIKNISISKTWDYKNGKGEEELREYIEETPALQKVEYWLLYQEMTNLIRSYKASLRLYSRKKKAEKDIHDLHLELPRFKSSGDRQTYRIKGKEIAVKDGSISLPGLVRIKCRPRRTITDEILYGTVIKEKTGQYFLSVNCQSAEEPPAPVPMTADKTVGIDMGIINFVTLSDEKVPPYPDKKFYEQQEKKIERLRRQKARRKEGGKNREKTAKKLEKLIQHTKNQRRDYNRKIASEITDKYDVIAIEDLHVKDMMEQQNDEILKKQIKDVGMRQLRTMLEYKGKQKGKRVIPVDRYFPSSQICSECGYRNTEVRNGKIRKWQCPWCHTWHDRDKNAAQNLATQVICLYQLK